MKAINKSCISFSASLWLNFLLCCILFITTSESKVYGQQFNFYTQESSVKHTGTMIKSHTLFDTITVVQPYWTDIQNNPGGWTSNMKFKSLRSFVKFYVDPGYNKKVNKYNYRITYKLYGYTNPTNLTQYNIEQDTLTIGYNPDSLTAYQDLQMKGYSNYHKIMIIVTGLYKIDSASSSPVPVTVNSNLADFNVIVEGTIQAQCYQKSNYGIGYTPAISSPNNSSAPFDYVEVSWNTAGTPASYELEWTYVDNYKVTPPSSQPDSITNLQSLQYNFKNNSTRVWLDTTYYRIPCIYQKGYLVYRVRTVRPDSNTYQYPIYSNWSNNNDNGTLNMEKPRKMTP